MAEVFEPCLGILVRHQIYKHARAKPRIMLRRSACIKEMHTHLIC